ncbi:MAG: hypothetical protein JAY64_11270 [Candidatus Thiodiazotropha weberae]|nr:hypothetical protein [Candidatus Thiodiazotropha lotti]MCG8012264.1 hypothetical protein [Candidatus Thiodiazotropha lotti]MCW4211734.1 hypothetical protein [Candidatus Thiodiazotropha lotti]MCW4216753.1 hypothetical protein [Candidatus Thiodiazotropha lotti]
MDEFVNRMATQRHVLNVVNNKVVINEQLFGLSSKSIDRWSGVNNLGYESELVQLLKNISSELFFMATRSQEPVSSEYELRRKNIVEMVSRLEVVL